MMGRLLIILASLASLGLGQPALPVKPGEKTLLCYIMSWSVYRPAEGKFPIEDIPATMCSHLVYTSMRISETYQIDYNDRWADLPHGMNNLGKLKKLKEVNPDLKLVLSVGGWGLSSETWSNMVQQNDSRQTFIKSAIAMLRLHGMDGLEIDWQFPAQRGGKLDDKENFAIFMEDARRALEKEGLLLIARLFTKRFIVELGYDVARISRAAHLVSLKTFEFHGHWDKNTGLWAPITSADEFNVQWSVNYMLGLGVPKQKLLLGLSTGGNALVLAEPPQHEKYLDVPIDGAFSGSFLSQDGFIGYNELCYEMSRSRLWKERWHNTSFTPYAFRGRHFTSYENRNSLEEKVRLVLEMDLAGVNLYALDTDDFGGHCEARTKYPLTSAVRWALGIVDPAPAPSRQTITTEEPSKPLVVSSVVGNEEYPRIEAGLSVTEQTDGEQTDKEVNNKRPNPDRIVFPS